MNIAIHTRNRPFSHELGVKCLIPGTCCSLQAYPTLLRIESAVDEIPLCVKGPVREFTLQQDLERGALFVWGHAQEGRFRLRLEVKGKELVLVKEKGPSSLVLKETRWEVKGPVQERPPVLERLSFGVHKAQNWPLVCKRGDLREILPPLFALSQWTPSLSSDEDCAMFNLMQKDFSSFFRAGFSGILHPRLYDEEFQGLLEKDVVKSQVSPSVLLTKAGALIRSQLLRQQGKEVVLLAPKALCGKMQNVQLSGIGSLDFEWSKGVLKKAILRADQTTSIRFTLPKAIRRYRLRESPSDRKGAFLSANQEWDIERNAVYILDRFEK